MLWCARSLQKLVQCRSHIQATMQPQRVANGRPRTSTFEKPGSVQINVRGAFIVDDDALLPRAGTRDIRLPHHHDAVSHIAVDIGGSLAKLVYFTRDAATNEGGGKLNFKSFETERIHELVEYMQVLIHGGHDHDEAATKSAAPYVIMATGGGAYKFCDLIKERLAVELYAEDEMSCLIIGLDFFIREIPDEVFTYSDDDPMQFVEVRPDVYPYLFVNIGSGVSIIKVSGPQQHQRIGGSSLGGGTLWGLLSMLTPATTFDDMLEAAENGNHTKVDMMVGDIYGRDYSGIGLKSTAVASTAGKMFKKTQQGVGLRPEDISRSLLMAISNNIGQLAYMHADKHGLERIYFGGSYIRGHRQTMNTLSRGLNFWSDGKKKAYFLRHEGYLGAVGAFLRQQPKNWGRRRSLEKDSSAQPSG